MRVFEHEATANRIVFVCDASGSMLNKFSTLRRELDKTIQRLRPTQSFNLVFFQEQGYSLFDRNGLVTASSENKLNAATYLESRITPRGETNPIPGVEIAFRQKPELIYLLTDGDFPDNGAVLHAIRSLNKDHKVRVNTIAFVSEADTDTQFTQLLQRIADENGGHYKHVKESDL